MAPLAPLATPMLRSPKGCKNIPGNANEGLTKLCKNLLKHASKSSKRYEIWLIQKRSLRKKLVATHLKNTQKKLKNLFEKVWSPKMRS